MSGSDFFVEFRSVIRVRCVYTTYLLSAGVGVNNVPP